MWPLCCHAEADQSWGLSVSTPALAADRALERVGAFVDVLLFIAPLFNFLLC